MSSFLPSAISPDQRLVAIVPPSSNGASGRLLVQIYQVATSQLQLTLTHAPAATAGPLKELVFCGTTTTSTKLVARLGNSQLIVWDLDRGVVAVTLDARDDAPEEFLGLATANDFFYSLTRHGTKLVVYEYNSNNNGGTLTRKIKSGRFDGDVGDADNGSQGMHLAVSESHVVVQTAPGVLRVMNSQTGKKIGKIKSSSTVFSVMKLFDDQTLVAAQKGGMVAMYDVASCALVQTIPHPVTVVDSSLSSDAFLQLQGDKLLVEGTIFQKQGKDYERLTSFKSTMNPIAPFLTSNDKVMVMAHQKQTGCKAYWFDLEDLSDLVDLDQVEKEGQATTTSTNSSSDKGPKRKLTTEPMILGPGQAGAEIVPPPVKKNKTVGESSEDVDRDDKGDDAVSSKDITIAERLQQLTNALEEEYANDNDDDDDDDDDVMDGELMATSKTNFKPHKATTESLKELMSQALQSGDDSLLELALSVRDVKVISTTLAEIGNAHIITLLSKLTTRLASNPLRAEGLALWISRCLKQGHFQPRHLAPLRNLLYERTESFADLLRLEGRLALMCDVE
jgi:U3 small nucleolar RNA-associated protein 5